MDHDGVVDVQSYYQNGKLVRREIHSEQLFEDRGSGAGS